MSWQVKTHAKQVNEYIQSSLKLPLYSCKRPPTKHATILAEKTLFFMAKFVITKSCDKIDMALPPASVIEAFVTESTA